MAIYRRAVTQVLDEPLWAISGWHTCSPASGLWIRMLMSMDWTQKWEEKHWKNMVKVSNRHRGAHCKNCRPHLGNRFWVQLCELSGFSCSPSKDFNDSLSPRSKHILKETTSINKSTRSLDNQFSLLTQLLVSYSPPVTPQVSVGDASSWRIF